MAHKHVVDAVATRLTDLWTATPVVMQNTQGETSPDGSSHIVVQFPVSNVSRWPINERLYVEEGGVRFVINCQRGVGTDEALTLAEQLATLFRDQTLDGVRFFVPSSPFLDDSNDVGSYFVATVVCPYSYTFNG